MRWRTVGWKEPQGPTRQVGCGCVGTWVESLRLQVYCTIVGSSMPMLGRLRCGRSGRVRGKFLRSIFGAPVAYRHEVPEDFEVMKVGHDLDTAVTRGHLLPLGSSPTSRLSTGSTFRGLGSVPIVRMLPG
ncbi:hypothetical protein BHE74_00006682 [Ensete ventricosum]|nr:hypothetical protein BHE74_00006682 [Ensete ventricosum]